MITDETLKEIGDKNENSLERFVVEYKGRLFGVDDIFEEGIEGQIKNQYKSYLSSMILAKGYDIKLLSEE